MYLYRKLRFLSNKKELKFAEHMLEKLLSGYDDKTIRLRKYKNFQRQPRQETVINCV